VNHCHLGKRLRGCLNRECNLLSESCSSSISSWQFRMAMPHLAHVYEMRFNARVVRPCFKCQWTVDSIKHVHFYSTYCFPFQL